MNKWWDFYDPSDPGHKVVIMDDVHPSWKDLPYLKQWADRYCTFNEETPTPPLARTTTTSKGTNTFNCICT